GGKRAVVAPHRFDEFRHLALGRNVERHAVAPALLGGVLVERLDIEIVEFDDLLIGGILHHVPVASARPLVAVSMRSLSSSAFRPPIGCLTTIRRGSTLRALAWANTSGLNVSVAIT